MLNQKIKFLADLGTHLNPSLPHWEAVKAKAELENPWFVKDFINLALNQWHNTLNTANIEKWVTEYSHNIHQPKTIGLVAAGNIPVVGLHDLICIWISGHTAQIKLSSKDKVLMETVLELIHQIDPSSIQQLQKVDKLTACDAFIATGSNNTSRYFEQYFGKKPSIIRGNRTSVAIINGNETEEELQLLSHDLFDYFGLGCRNVGKVYIPETFDITHFLDNCRGFEWMADHHRMSSNYQYHRAIFLMNQTAHLDTGYCLFKESGKLHPPLGCVFYERYNDKKDVYAQLNVQHQQIQCIVDNQNVENSIIPGTTQKPTLHDYADGVDTLSFLLNIE